MGEAKRRSEHYEAFQKDDPKIYFPDHADPNGEIHVYEKFRNLEAMFVVLMRAYVRSDARLPLLLEGKLLDSEKRVGVESGLYENVAQQLIDSVEVWRGEAAGKPS